MSKPKPPKVSFHDFLDKFPEIELPVTLTNDTQLEFSRSNEPLPQAMVAKLIAAIEGEDPDEFTEFVPCLKIPKTHDFHAIVYWKAGLMSYQYILATLTKKGELIDKAAIAGTYSDGESLVQSVATIEDDWIIYIISGKTEAEQTSYDASSSKAFNLELLATGEIITSN